MIKFFDAHTHTQFNAFKNDFKDVIERAILAGVGLINVGTQKDTSKKALELAYLYQDDPEKHQMIYATVGLHPIHTSKHFYDAQELEGIGNSFVSRGEEFDYKYYKNLALDSKVLAIGECGLDYFRINDNDQKLKQVNSFEAQIKLAYEVKKPLMIHCRDAFSDLISILKSQKNYLNNPPGIIHFFSGDKKEAEELLKMGFYFTFGGVITFSQNYNEIIKFLPKDKILSETDAPYVAPSPYRGKRNEPVYVVEVVKKLAEIKNIDFEKMRIQILKNTTQVFKLKF